MLLLLAFIIVLLFFGLGFALHFLWIIAAIFLFLWLDLDEALGSHRQILEARDRAAHDLEPHAVGRGESAGRHRFYRW